MIWEDYLVSFLFVPPTSRCLTRVWAVTGSRACVPWSLREPFQVTAPRARLCRAELFWPHYGGRRPHLLWRDEMLYFAVDRLSSHVWPVGVYASPLRWPGINSAASEVPWPQRRASSLPLLRPHSRRGVGGRRPGRRADLAQAPLFTVFGQLRVTSS